MSLRTSPLAGLFYRICDTRVLPVLRRRNIRPDQLTWAGLLAGLLVVPGFMLHPAIGLFWMAVSGILDALDGYLAKKNGEASSFGAFLDSSLDRIADAFYLLGFYVLFMNTGSRWVVLVLFFLSVVFTFMISYTRARAEALGGRCEVGFFERGARVAGLFAWGFLVMIFPAHLSLWAYAGFSLYTVLAFLTVVQRMTHMRRAFGKSDSAPENQTDS